MKTKTAELTGVALDWAVAKCEGYQLDLVPEGEYTPSTDWSQGGPLIEREKLAICIGWKQWLAFSDDTENAGAQGPTPLIAAMRCYVASKLGDEVEVPDGLV
jgi:hypothetical protein